MASGIPRRNTPFEQASKRLWYLAILSFVVVEIVIIASAVVDAAVSHHGALRTVLVILLFSTVSALLVFLSIRFSTRLLQQAADAEFAREQAERELEEAREYEHVLLNLPIAFAVLLDLEGRVLAINETGARSLGYSADKVSGRLITDLLAEEELSRIREIGDRIRETGKAFVVTAVFGGRHFTQHVVPVKDEEGKTARVAVFGVDVTDRVLMHRKLKESEERYRNLFENSVDGIVLTSPDWRVVDCNESFARMLDYEVEDLKGACVRELTPLEWQSVDRDVVENQVLPTGRSDRYEKEYRRSDGSLLPAAVRLWALRDEDGRTSGVWARVEDMSKQKQYEDFIRQTIIRLEEANERLREVDRLKTEFVGMVSHELRAPIAAMESGFAALKALGPGASGEQRDQLLGVLERGATRLRHLVEDLLDISRIESGQLKLVMEDVDAVELAGRVTDLHAGRYADKGIYLRLEHDNGSMPLRCDPRRIEQVLTNLIDNAMKFTERGGVTVKLDTTPNSLVFAVIDSGPGILPSLHEQVFEKFFSHGSPEGHQGVGLGLAICRGIVEGHGGRMWVESHAGSGATFRFELPL